MNETATEKANNDRDDLLGLLCDVRTYLSVLIGHGLLDPVAADSAPLLLARVARAINAARGGK